MDFICFEAHNEKYAVRIDEAIAIIPIPEITGVPGTIPAIKGMFSYLGELIPVVDLSQLYDGVDEFEPLFVIMVKGDRKYAILSQGIKDIIRGEVPMDIKFLSIHDIENAVMSGAVASNEGHIELF